MLGIFGKQTSSVSNLKDGIKLRSVVVDVVKNGGHLDFTKIKKLKKKFVLMSEPTQK